MKNTKLNLSILIIVIAAAAGGIFLYKRKNHPAQEQPAVQDEQSEKDENLTSKIEFEPKKDVENPEFSKEELKKKLEEAIGNKDYKNFADILRIIYDYNWQGEKELLELESKFYVIGADEYYKKGNYEEGLRMAEIISGKVFESWRFKYLRVLCLEGLGLEKLEKGDYDKAEEYAMKMLSIEFRPEGADLLARVNIEKAKTAYKNGKTNEALSFLAKVEDYELTKERREEIEKLKLEIGN
ncbi:hypothetical protein A2Y83_00835 [Candidatus Falkowbacteria bacterium RBG_13_39_14]|uniref:Uncharacterized protein n=1 Tax=Candidatus Falkowbacteria bacterium RBG_13_39_14 TaxID=1797985 RepID=A0A1F5S2M3_9BACT|nr:MAG: hypothetical protein A2Y83_00835 [Candidatus Falkowbacteria bacterium RBG_13_39_14]